MRRVPADYAPGIKSSNGIICVRTLHHGRGITDPSVSQCFLSLHPLHIALLVRMPSSQLGVLPTFILI